MGLTHEYLEHCRGLADGVAQQAAAIDTAADWFAETILRGRMVHLFGSGHSRILVEEMWPRYGSFPGFNPIVELSLSFHNLVGGANGQRQAMFLENVGGLAERILRNYVLSAEDNALVISSSGCSVVPTEMAEGFHRRGLRVVAIVSREHAEALLPIVRSEVTALVEAGCEELTVDEPSMSCYAHREDPRRFVDIFNRTVEPVEGRCRLSTHLCFGNFKEHAVGLRRYAPMFPAFLEMHVDELHLEMASREFAELEIIGEIARHKDVAVGIIDVKSYYLEAVDDVAVRVRACLAHAPAERLALAPDCGLSQTARWAAQQKLQNLVAGVQQVHETL